MIRLNTLGWWLWSCAIFIAGVVASASFGDWFMAALFMLFLVLSATISLRLIRLAQSGHGDAFTIRSPKRGVFARWLYRETLEQKKD